MKASWRCRFAEHARVLHEVAPNLTLTVSEQPPTAEITGMLEIPIGSGRSEPVAVRLVFKGGTPFKLPVAYITDGHFPPCNDRHIGANGWLCMWLPQTAPVYFTAPLGLEAFICDLREFLARQFMYDDRRRRNLEPFWPGPQWEHGASGHRQWVREHVGALTREQLRPLLGAMNRLPRRTASCPCGSRRSLGSCHLVWLRQLRSVVSREPDAATELNAILHGESPAASEAH